MLEKSCNYQGPVRGTLENGVGLCFENEGTSGFICEGEAFLFDEKYNFPELIPERDLVIAKKDEFFGVMDFAGNIKIPFQQSYVSYQEKDGVFFVRNSNQCSVVNAEDFFERMTGEYDDIVPFLEGQAIVEKNERYGIIDLAGNIKMPVSCQEIHVLDNGAYWYKKGKTYLYDKNGLPPDNRYTNKILGSVMEKIEAAEIWIPLAALERYYLGRRNNYRKRYEKSREDGKSV